MSRRNVSSGSPFEPVIGFSRAVRVGDRVLVSGTAPVWPDGSCDPDAGRQAERCLHIIDTALAEAGASLDDVSLVAVTQTYYLRYAASGFDPNDFGLVLALAIPLALYLAVRVRSVRWIYLAIVPTVVAAVVLTASRASLIATFVAFTFTIFAWRAADRAFRTVSVICGPSTWLPSGS